MEVDPSRTIARKFEVSANSTLPRCGDRLEEDNQKYQAQYRSLMADVVLQSPACRPDFNLADQMIKSGQRYKALKGLKKLIRHEAFSLSDKRPLGPNSACTLRSC
jgi:flagellar biosynthesis regulator FlbT